MADFDGMLTSFNGLTLLKITYNDIVYIKKKKKNPQRKEHYRFEIGIKLCYVCVTFNL